MCNKGLKLSNLLVQGLHKSIKASQYSMGFRFQNVQTGGEISLQYKTNAESSKENIKIYNIGMQSSVCYKFCSLSMKIFRKDTLLNVSVFHEVSQ